MRLARYCDGLEMTHIETKSTNISLNVPSETLGETEASLSPEALALFSSVFVQMQPEIEGATEITSQTAEPAEPAVISSITGTTSPLGFTVSQENIVGADAIDLVAVEDYLFILNNFMLEKEIDTGRH